MMDVLINFIVIIISKHRGILLYTLNLHNVICQLHLNKGVKFKVK